MNSFSSAACGSVVAFSAFAMGCSSVPPEASRIHPYHNQTIAAAEINALLFRDFWQANPDVSRSAFEPGQRINFEYFPNNPRPLPLVPLPIQGLGVAILGEVQTIYETCHDGTLKADVTYKTIAADSDPSKRTYNEHSYTAEPNEEEGTLIVPDSNHCNGNKIDQSITPRAIDYTHMSKIIGFEQLLTKTLVVRR